MMTYVVDASAALRYLLNEAGADRVEQLILEKERNRAQLLISSVNWGEIATIVLKRYTYAVMQQALTRLDGLGFEVIPTSADQAVRAGVLKLQTKIPYADAFAVALAEVNTESVLLTADYDFQAAQHLVKIELLPLKS